MCSITMATKQQRATWISMKAAGESEGEMLPNLAPPASTASRCFRSSTCENGTVPSGQVYRPLIDAQVQLSRCLQAGRRDRRTECLTAEDSQTASRQQQDEDDDDVYEEEEEEEDVSRLPDIMGVERSGSDINERLLKKRKMKHDDALRRLDETLRRLTEDCERTVRTLSQQLLSSLQDSDRSLDHLKVSLENLEPSSLEEECVLWEQVTKELKTKKTRITDFGSKLRECESRRTSELRAALRFCWLQMENVGFQGPGDVQRLLHGEAMMLNQCLLANRRSIARLLLLLREEALQQEALLRRGRENRQRLRRENQVQQEVQVSSTDQDPDQDPDQDQDQDPEKNQVLQLVSVQRALTAKRLAVIDQLSSLAPPTASISLVSDWFNQLTAVNEEMDACHASLQEQRCVSDPAPAEDRDIDTDAQVCSAHAVQLSKAALQVMLAATALWETHRGRLEGRQEELQRHLEDVRCSWQQDIQRKTRHVDELLRALRQESSEDDAKESLDRIVSSLKDIRDSCGRSTSSQRDVLDPFPSVLLDELVSYSRSLSAFFRISQAYQPSPEDLHKLHPSLRGPAHLDPELEKEPIVCQDDSGPAHSSQDWLTEAESSLLEFYDVDSHVSFISMGGVVYSCPAFRSPALPAQLQQHTHLSVFPVEFLTHTLKRTQTRFLDHLEKHFFDVLNDAVAMVTEKTEALRLEQEIQLQHLDPEHIQNHVYRPRLAELQLHRQQVDVHCRDMSVLRTSCRTQLAELQSSTHQRTQDLLRTLSSIDRDVQAARSSKCLQALGSTLQDCLGGHVRDAQRCESSFRHTVSGILEEVRTRTEQLIASFKLFSEGGDFSPQEVKTFQKTLKEDSRQTDVDEDFVFSELEALESRSLQQMTEASTRLEEKISAFKSKTAITEKIQKKMSSTHVLIQAEKNSSNQQQSSISMKLQDLKKMLQDRPEQACELQSSLSEDLKARCRYLGLDWDWASQQSLALQAPSRPRDPVQDREGPPPKFLQASRRGADFLEDPILDLLRSLNRLGSGSGSAAEKEDRGAEPGQRSQQHLSKSNKLRFPALGTQEDPDVDQGSRSFGGVLDEVLGNADEALRLGVEEFSRLARLQCLPQSHQWAEAMKQRLLGYQEDATKFLSSSREEVLKQLVALDQLVRLVPQVPVRNQ